jgi:hypothetical protein
MTPKIRGEGGTLKNRRHTLPIVSPTAWPTIYFGAIASRDWEPKNIRGLGTRIAAEIPSYQIGEFEVYHWP